MRNLKLSSHHAININVEQNTKLCVDPVTNIVYAVNTKGVFMLTKEDRSTFHDKTWKDADTSITEIVNAEVITSLSSICIISVEDVITVNLENGFVEVVGCVSDGISASAWSPDQEVLALVTRNQSVVLMTTDFDPIAEFPLDQDDFGEGKFINVGWGKKETQFHGSLGKQAAQETTLKATPIFDWDRRHPKITWRGDGQLFAVSYIDSSNVRKLRVVSREGAIQSTSEELEGIEDCLSWKPSGNLIASSQRLSHKHNIIFFEKNGLQHGGFALPFHPMEMKVKEVLWNSDSSILLVWLEPMVVEKMYSLLQFWTVGNYHWYLKEELRFDPEISDLKWDSENPFLLHSISSSSLHHFRFISSVDASHGKSDMDSAQVTVIDGCKLLITPFRFSVVPPPLAAYEAVFKNQIHSVIHAPSTLSIANDSIDSDHFLGSNPNNICVFHGRETLTFLVQTDVSDQLSTFDVEVKMTALGGNGLTVRAKVHRVLSQVNLKWDPDESIQSSFSPENLYNWSWVSPNAIVSCFRQENRNSVILFDLQENKSEDLSVKVNRIIDVEEEVITISPSSDMSFVCLQLITGELLKLNIANESIMPWVKNGDPIKFPTVCDQVILCSVDGTCVPLGLTSRNRLYMGNLQILSDCTSIHLHTDHILLTSTSHTLLVVPLNMKSLKSLNTGFVDEFTTIGTRRLERGSRIVSAVPCDTKVVLQMPRGNLELIHPRPLTVHTLKRLLDDKNFDLAIDIMRRQRIDLNLLYDHNPEHFRKNIHDFVRIINNPHWIDLFIVSLNNSDSTATCYRTNYENKDSSCSTDKNTNKIDLVCELLRRAMQDVNEEKFLLPILSTYVKSSKAEIHEALLKLKQMKNSGNYFEVSFEEGLRHLLYVTDVNELLDIALGTYDFELVMLVFEKSQKDPKEYLPFLNNLKQMDENYRKFKINVHLKRFNRALECIVHCEKKYHEECLDIIIKESLYQKAFEVFPLNIPLYRDTCIAYADYLGGKGYDNEAAVMYIRGGHWEKALEAYIQANNWKRALATASEMNLSKSRFRKVCLSLVEKLRSKNCFLDAAIIYDQYIGSEEDAVECYCKACCWEEALLLSKKHKRLDLIETNLKPGIMEHFHATQRNIKESLENFKKYLHRLMFLWSKKKEEYRDFLEGKKDDYLDPDLYSDSSTITGFSYQRSHISSTSSKTFRSSKNKRKLEKKKHSIKEGSAYEDLGLVVALHDLMTSVSGLADTVSDLTRIMVFFGQDLSAGILQQDLNALIQEMKKNKSKIWLNPSHEDESVEFGPQMTTENALKQMKGDVQTETGYLVKRFNELEENYRHPPNLDKITGWKLFVLR